MRAIYDFTNKPGQSKANFLQNEWAKKYRRVYSTYRAYLADMDSKAVLDASTKTYTWQA